MPCRHPDIQTFDGVRCCLACGESTFSASLIHNSEDIEREFKYIDLNKTSGQHIRLLILYPGEGSNPIVCEFSMSI
ncbi:hypothetical protein K458DRAFT_453747 [Lentithecium fluviatile CBS 122367]|uniref:Uncharacterized protein n=1 Tax=Lentithecium fluviatile CBS 122367 TaxID=1168545 RepID=A0A6G1IWV5_9PLEO|nr:hypothetical protein K458DRAFT_453747 [Lentithecium fluviatile CBS 122367]